MRARARTVSASECIQSVSGDEGRGGGGRGEDGERPFLRDRRGLSQREREAGPSESGGGADGTHHGAASGGRDQEKGDSLAGFLRRSRPSLERREGIEECGEGNRGSQRH